MSTLNSFADFLQPLDYSAAEKGPENPCGEHLFSICSPWIFNSSGYPYNVSSMGELSRMASSGNFEETLPLFTHSGGLTSYEYELLKSSFQNWAR